jgi:hypothetical protein
MANTSGLYNIKDHRATPDIKIDIFSYNILESLIKTKLHKNCRQGQTHYRKGMVSVKSFFLTLKQKKLCVFKLKY